MIISIKNPQVKRIQQLQKKSKVREEEGLFIVEGFNMAKELPKEMVEKIYISESFQKKQELKLEGISEETLSDNVFSHVSATQSPQGILALVRMPKYQKESFIEKKEPYIIMLDSLQDPGNLGTILRTAEAAGVDGVIMNKECVDIFNPKVIRSTMGAIFRVPFCIAEDLQAEIALMKAKGISVFAAHLEGIKYHNEVDYSKGSALLIGNEGNGIREEIVALADEKVQIPMEGEVESLNAAVSAAIFMYEAYLQRRKR